VKTQGQLYGLDVCGRGVNIRGQDASWGLRLAPGQRLNLRFHAYCRCFKLEAVIENGFDDG
jgi:hypothetical protein